MLTRKVKRIICELKRLGPDKLILFGSYARASQDKDSDIDIIFIKKRFPESRIIDRIHSIYKMLTISGVDVIPYTPREISRRLKFNDFFLEDALSDGIVLYEKKA